MRLLSVFKLLPIVETSVMSENDGITVKQTVAHTILLWPHGLGTIISYVFKTSSRISGAGPYDTIIKGPLRSI